MEVFMKMQELITEFRDEIPKLAKHHKEAGDLYRKVWGLWDDYMRCESEEGHRLLIDAAREAMNRFSARFVDMSASVEALERLNAGYTRKLGPRKTGQNENPRQMKLGLEPSLASQADGANSAFAAGRHG
jgi:hypothetical protein